MIDPIWSYLFKTKETLESKELDLLKLTGIFTDFSNKDLKAIHKILHRRSYKKNELVFSAGDPGIGMYIIFSGRVNIYVHNPRTEEEDLVAKLQSGQYFGDVALFSDALRSATIKAIEPTTLLGFCQPDLLGFIDRNPQLGSKILLQILKMAGKRLDTTNRLLSETKHELLNLQQSEG